MSGWKRPRCSVRGCRGLQCRPTALDHQIECSLRALLLGLRKVPPTAPFPASHHVVVDDHDFRARGIQSNELQSSIADHRERLPSGMPQLRPIARRHVEAITLAVWRNVLGSSYWGAVNV